ncbi:unnamed protein product [Rhizophagus irregularis]|nr:unnamed protein product [Rhizophagus irregularis]CAB4442948.1 unnamed protein product [Rhizophagus irregularis]
MDSNSQYDNWFYIVQDRFPIYEWIGWKWISGSWVDWMKPKELLRNTCNTEHDQANRKMKLPVYRLLTAFLIPYHKKFGQE